MSALHKPVLNVAQRPWALQQFREARADLEQVVSAEPGNAEAWVLLAEVLDNLGERDKAETAQSRGA